MSTVSGSASNASPPATRPLQQHTRTYQACIPCRRRKVRCDLGPVDNPHDPPCVRCRRESKECFFSATRRKRKGQDGEDLDEPVDDYEIRNGRKRSRTAPETIHIPRPPSGNYVSQPLTPGGSVGRYEPLRRPTNHSNTSEDPRHEEDDQNVSNATAGILQTKEVFSGHDALNLLFEAAGRNGDIAHHRSSSASNHARPSMGATAPPSSATRFASPQMTSPNGFDNRNHAPTAPEPSFGPAREQSEVPILPEPRNDPSLPAAIQAWRKFRLVRAGWLTAKEAIAYVDYFYTYLSPLTPIVVPDYRDYALHGKLLKEEPMLVVTILTITSRFVIPNTGGARTRSYHMHSKYWDYLKGMIDRMIFGQEQFGGGFCGAGQQPGSDTNPLSRKGLRTLGTVESLMLLTEWHPRALHFPPGDDDDELVLPDDLGEVDARAEHKASGGQRIDSWLEPCWRSDRMCWMLLGNATALAFEIGVFDDTSEAEFEEENRHLSHATVKAYFRRKNHLKDLLKIYITQTSGRLGLTTMLPKLERTYEIPTKTPNELYEERVAQIKPPPPNLGMRPSGPDGNRLPFESVATQHRHAVQDLVLDFWSRIALIMDMGNQKLFPNRRQTRDLLKSGKYEELLRYFQTPLLDWSRSFALADKVPKQLRYVLTIEYEYTRVYLNSLALQAVVERCTHNTPQQQHTNLNGTLRDRDGGAIPFSTLVKWYGNDRHYISEVIDASRNVLRAVVEGLYPGDYLRHAPVRTFFRIVSVAIILLKTFALGATEDDVAYSLGLLDRAVSALRTSIVDDVHVGNRFAELVETLTRRIRSRFVRLSANASTGISRAGSRSPTRNGTLTPTMGPPRQPLQPQSNPGHLQPPYSGPGAGYTSATTSVPGSPSLNLTSGRQTPNPSLWGISAEPYDPTSGQHSIMPPPGFNPNNSNFDYMQQNQNYNNVNGYDSSGGFNQGDQDWLTLPLDPLLNQWGADITQTAMGPDVGGMDMLDILLNMGGGPPGSA